MIKIYKKIKYIKRTRINRLNEHNRLQTNNNRMQIVNNRIKF
jgi:hypothetical protein